MIERSALVEACDLLFQHSGQGRTVQRLIDYDPAGSTYEIDWKDWYKRVCTLLQREPGEPSGHERMRID
jgi:hypothetical protein